MLRHLTTRRTAQAGELSLEAKQYAQALAEFQVALALDPPNMAEANYNVASAYPFWETAGSETVRAARAWKLRRVTRKHKSCC